MLYAFWEIRVGDHWRVPKYTINGVANATIRDLITKERCEWSYLTKVVNTCYTIDPVTNRLFFTQNQFAISLFDGDLSKEPISSMKKKVVMADGAFTNYIGNLRVAGILLPGRLFLVNTYFISWPLTPGKCEMIL